MHFRSLFHRPVGLLLVLRAASTCVLAAPAPAPAAVAAVSNSVRAEAVKEAYLHSWNGYVKYAFGDDELLSVSNIGSNSRNGWGATIADALSTGILMGLNDVVAKQLEHIAKVDFSKTDSEVSVFETTIRYIGGLLSGYDLLKGPYAHLVTDKQKPNVDALLTQAKNIADRMSFAFDTKSGIPRNNLNYSTNSSPDKNNGLATTGTLILEWTRLSDLLGDPKYARLAAKAESYLLKPNKEGEPFPGLLGYQIDVETGRFIDNVGGWGGGTDSFYEYLIKMWVYDPKRFAEYKERWILAASSTIKHLASHPEGHPSTLFVAGWRGTNLTLSMQHLTCFIGGNFLLGGTVLDSQEFSDFGAQLTSGCHETYAGTPSHIGPEVYSWDPKKVPTDQTSLFKKSGFYITQSSYNLRPEVVESYYHAYKLTGDKKYQEWAWDAFLAINKTCRTDSGYTSISNVGVEDGGRKEDFMESFWFAEVLKYFWLIFDGSVDGEVGVVKGKAQKWVFNTEAHPVRVFEG